MPDFGNFGGERPDFSGRRGGKGSKGTTQPSDDADTESTSEAFSKSGKRTMV